MTHLIDAVRVHTLKQRLERDLANHDARVTAAWINKLVATIRSETLSTEEEVLEAMQYLKDEQQQVIKDSTKTIEAGPQRAEAVKQQLRMVNTSMRLCLKAVFETYDAYIDGEGGDGLLLSWTFGEALQRCRRSWQNLEREEVTFKTVITTRKAGVRKQPLNLNGSAASSDTIASAAPGSRQSTPDEVVTTAAGTLPVHQIMKSLNQIRQCYTELQDDLLGRHAKALLGHRAQLPPQPLTFPNLLKNNDLIPSNIPSTNAHLPNSTDIPTPPPLSPTPRALSRKYLALKSAVKRSIVSRSQAGDLYLRSYLSYLVAYPGCSYQTFHDLYITSSGRSWTEEEAALIAERERLEAEETRAWEDLREYSGQGIGDLSFLSEDEEMSACAGDFVGSSVVASWRGSEGKGDRKRVNGWRSGVVSDSMDGHVTVERPNSSALLG